MSGDDDRSTASFLRGLTIGAIIGAILAGSSIWSRRRADSNRARTRRPQDRSVARPELWLVLISTRPRSSAAGCSTSAISRVAMNRAVRTGFPTASPRAPRRPPRLTTSIAARPCRHDVERLTP